MKCIFNINSKTWDKDIQRAYIDSYPGMELGEENPVMGMQADYIIDIEEMELSFILNWIDDFILNWIDDQTEYGEVECEIMAALCEKYGVEYNVDDIADDVYERLRAADPKKKFMVKQEYFDKWGCDDDSMAIVTLGQIKELAEEWDVDVDTLMDQVDEL